MEKDNNIKDTKETAVKVEKEITAPVSNLYDTLKKREEVRLLIPMGFVPGMPMLGLRNGKLVLTVPFLRYKLTGEVDRTLVYPVKYLLEYEMPKGKLVGFRDLTLAKPFEEINLDKTIGFFRHEAAKHLDRNAFNQLKDETLRLYDELVLILTGRKEGDNEQANVALSANLKVLVEPFVAKQYAVIDPDFANMYLK